MRDPPLPKLTTAARISRRKGDSSPCHSQIIKSYETVWAEGIGKNVRNCDAQGMRADVQEWAGSSYCDTKALLCNQLGVKSPLCGPHKGSQRQGAGGWGGSAATQLCAEPTHPGSIWALLTSVAAWPLLPLGPGTMKALGRPLCCKVFQSPFLA